MKKIFLSIVAVAALFATSCITEATSDVYVKGSECDVNFKLNVPSLGSRAEETTIGTGFKATQLHYAVYDAAWVLLESDVTSFEANSLEKELSFRLVKNKTYNFVFWAQAPTCDAYTVSLGTVGSVSTPNVAVSYNKAANDDYRDAFFGNTTITVDGAVNETVPLSRPFAQINFGTADVDQALKMGYNLDSNVTKTSFKTVAYTNLNLATGAVSDTQEVTVEFTASQLPENKVLKTQQGEYFWTAMNYILWPDAADLSLAVCEMTITTDNQQPITISVPGAPARRNWRTHLVGELLTDTESLKVVITPGFTNEFIQ